MIWRRHSCEYGAGVEDMAHVAGDVVLDLDLVVCEVDADGSLGGVCVCLIVCTGCVAVMCIELCGMG